MPVSPKRFAATLSRAKLLGHFTDTVFSFRATRTIFRPYQFKPVQKLLDTGTLRLLIADEVGLGKTIEAGLVWTEMEARRQADRVLVVCPSMLVGKWRREMEDRFGFILTELDATGLDDLLNRLESGRLPRRAAYISSIQRLRMWDGLERATELGGRVLRGVLPVVRGSRQVVRLRYQLCDADAAAPRRQLPARGCPVRP
jgi:SNF2-related domain